MFRLQVNIGTNANPQWMDVENTDSIVFCDGYKGSSGFSGINRIANDFVEISGNYAKKSYLLRDNNVWEINWDSEKIMGDDTSNLKTLSFRYVYVNDSIDWIRVPEFRTIIPKTFYGYTPINTNLLTFFQTDQSDIAVGHEIELDGNIVEVTKVEPYGDTWKVFFRVLESNFIIDKSKYICRNYSLHQNVSGIKMKVFFHDQFATSFVPPDPADDVTDQTIRKHTNEGVWMDVDTAPIWFELSPIDDLTNWALISDATLTQNVEYSSTVLYLDTTRFVDFRRGDWIVLRNSVWNEAMRIETINSNNHALTVYRPFTHQNFLSSDNSVKVFLNMPVYFQPFIFTDGNNSGGVNAPVVVYFDLR